jgi:hypothetical protein
MATEEPIQGYPADLQIEYPESANRLTTFFRMILIIPVQIILSLVTYAISNLFMALMLMILFRKKYPRWWFDWNFGITRFSMRVISYGLLLLQVYPSTDEDQGVNVKLVYPDAERELSRGLPLVKWLLAIPHYIVLMFLWIAVMVVTFIAWFAILFTGKYPRGMYDFVVGVLRWSLRVEAYTVLLTTDEYPPFSLQS